ncbi:hypothetical protein RFI_29721 [Reticulomyxa filosa]|uniref:Uncharacterized protein n=1 Tax=Reticulomyxa filosa TaxID=46433 RepID=X6M1A3_RETFI|nr:hypothetical protein RFI_29721 [Reticulomyxa filosa]|eukprot:ETO07669.1 hypothetical protein RFI_29721 [Reticulomyxa filosa]
MSADNSTFIPSTTEVSGTSDVYIFAIVRTAEVVSMIILVLFFAIFVCRLKYEGNIASIVKWSAYGFFISAISQQVWNITCAWIFVIFGRDLNADLSCQIRNDGNVWIFAFYKLALYNFFIVRFDICFSESVLKYPAHVLRLVYVLLFGFACCYVIGSNFFVTVDSWRIFNDGIDCFGVTKNAFLYALGAYDGFLALLICALFVFKLIEFSKFPVNVVRI